LFETLSVPKTDPLVLVNRLCKADDRAGKLDLGVGVYRDADGLTPVPAVVKEAEKVLYETQLTKAYLAPDGDQHFAQLLGSVVLGADHGVFRDGRLVAAQAPGGTGSFRLGLDFLAASKSPCKVWVGLPTWPNHIPMIEAAGLVAEPFPYYDVASAQLRFDRMLSALELAKPGDAVLLHGCCHNPTGADLAIDDWHTLTDIVARRGLVPIVDLAYQGLGRGLDADVAGLRYMIARVPEAIVAVSCSKNFGLYRERTGLLMVACRNRGATEGLREILLSRARLNYSMPPDHGASVVRLILESEQMTLRWRDGVAAMRLRITSVREQLAGALRASGFAAEHIRDQQGLFVMMPLGLESIRRLRQNHGIYMAETGRISIAGLRADMIDRFAEIISAEVPNA